MESMDEEQKWALGTLTIFLILLIISGISDFVEVGIGVCTFLFSWLAVSYSIRNFGKGGTSKEELQNTRLKSEFRKIKDYKLLHTNNTINYIQNLFAEEIKFLKYRFDG